MTLFEPPAPDAPGALQKYPTLVIGFLLALVQAITYVVGLGSFEDGVQLPDVLLVVTTLLGFLGLKSLVFSQRTVDEIEPNRTEQKRAVKRVKQRR